MSLVEQYLTRRKQVAKIMSKLEFAGNNGDEEVYKVEAICDSVVYAKESESDHPTDLYYLV